MKLSIIIAIVMVLAFANAKRGDPIIRDGEELLRYMEGDLPGTWIVFFYKISASTSKTSNMREEIKRKILDRYPNFHYHEIDVDTGAYDNIVRDMQVDETDLKHSPTIMVASDGHGYWAHGEGAVNEILTQLPRFSEEARRK